MAPATLSTRKANRTNTQRGPDCAGRDARHTLRKTSRLAGMRPRTGTDLVCRFSSTSRISRTRSIALEGEHHGAGAVLHSASRLRLSEDRVLRWRARSQRPSSTRNLTSARVECSVSTNICVQRGLWRHLCGNTAYLESGTRDGRTRASDSSARSPMRRRGHHSRVHR